MAPVGRRRSASARRPGLQLPDAPAACQLASPSGGHLDRPVRGGRRSQGRQEEGTRRCPSAVQLGKGKPLMRDARPQGPTLMWAVTRAGRESCPATKATTLGAEQKLEIGKELDRGQAGSAETWCVPPSLDPGCSRLPWKLRTRRTSQIVPCKGGHILKSFLKRRKMCLSVFEV
nr:uncharacterized protein LOC103235440 isoform X2 [Chlorocebus sabaeus]